MFVFVLVACLRISKLDELMSSNIRVVNLPIWRGVGRRMWSELYLRFGLSLQIYY